MTTVAIAVAAVTPVAAFHPVGGEARADRGGERAGPDVHEGVADEERREDALGVIDPEPEQAAAPTSGVPELARARVTEGGERRLRPGAERGCDEEEDPEQPLPCRHRIQARALLYHPKTTKPVRDGTGEEDSNRKWRPGRHPTGCRPDLHQLHPDVTLFFHSYGWIAVSGKK